MSNAAFRPQRVASNAQSSSQYQMDENERDLQITSGRLLPFNSFEQGLEVASAKSIEVVALNNLEEDRGAIQHWFRENLEQVAPFVEVDQYIVLLYTLEVFAQLHSTILQPQAHGIIVRLRHLDELTATLSQILDTSHNVVGSKGNVLDPGSAIEIDELFDL